MTAWAQSPKNRCPATGATGPGAAYRGYVTNRSLVLASASPARLRLLRDAGIEPTVIVSGVDEDEIAENDPHTLVESLAIAKSRAVSSLPEASGALVLGCDSMLEFYGEVLGKPGTPEAWQDRPAAHRPLRHRHGDKL
jgi:septum formation protein